MRTQQQTVAIAEPKKPKPKPLADGAPGGKDQQDARAGALPPVVAVKIKGKRKKYVPLSKDVVGFVVSSNNQRVRRWEGVRGLEWRRRVRGGAGACLAAMP